MRAPAIELHQLTVHYGARPALVEVEARLAGGSLVALLGPNGAGKSTLLRTMLGWHPPTSGAVRIGAGSERGPRPRIAYLPQHPAIDWDFPIAVRSVVEQGRYGDRGRSGFGPEEHASVDRALAELELTAVADRPIRQLSGGQQQRMFLARAVAQNADILLLDEPFAGLDPRATAELAAILVRWQTEGRTVIAALHDLAVARAYFHQALLINTRLIAAGPVAEVLVPTSLQAAFGSSL